MIRYLPDPQKITLNQILQTVLIISISWYFFKPTPPPSLDEFPAEHWIQNISLAIPDHEIGQENHVIMDYEIDLKNSFSGKYVIEVQEITSEGFVGIQLCESGIIPYSTDKTPPSQITIGWFKGLKADGPGVDINSTCKWVIPYKTAFTTGQYRACLVHRILDVNKSTKQVCSNIYRKYEPKDSPAYIEHTPNKKPKD